MSVVCTCVIIYTSIYTCRLASTILKVLTQWHTLMHMYTQPYTMYM